MDIYLLISVILLIAIVSLLFGKGKEERQAKTEKRTIVMNVEVERSCMNEAKPCFDSRNVAVKSEGEALGCAIKLVVKTHQRQVDKTGVLCFDQTKSVMEAGNTDSEKIVGLLGRVLDNTELTVNILLDEGFSDELIAALQCVTRRENE